MASQGVYSPTVIQNLKHRYIIEAWGAQVVKFHGLSQSVNAYAWWLLRLVKCIILFTLSTQKSILNVVDAYSEVKCKELIQQLSNVTRYDPIYSLLIRSHTAFNMLSVTGS